jgi:hypothetical protein
LNFFFKEERERESSKSLSKSTLISIKLILILLWLVRRIRMHSRASHHWLVSTSHIHELWVRRSHEHHIIISYKHIRMVCEIKRSILLFFSLFGFLFNSFFIQFLDWVNSRSQLSSYLNKERHSVLHHSESPSQFHNNVWLNQFVSSI